MYNDVLTLISVTKTVDEYGDTAETKTENQVFCEVLGIGTSEFYQAQSVGMKPEIKLKIADYLDYSGEKTVVYDGNRYKVLRTYRTDGNELEITLHEGVRLEGVENAST